ncbi:receptor-type tyrosine-protein phosphatase alpha-like [Physella acuta]|uniref:receptor-type tyrosine-protein phosphatase alpha-like n=1 Tax=Physella acuta TaxID=109671 RepID=UPI0027DC5F9A|nr:receptor-type tyrosine-protein phosphatase alpha-like [Physella acuta]
MYDLSSTNEIEPSYTQISVSNFLTLCEVEIYGDNQCVGKTYGLECNNTCNCYNGQETCFVATGGCASGCAEGYHGEGCSKECDAGWFGSNCMYQCHCANNYCNTSGDCINGVTCDMGWFGNHCQFPCSDTFYGANCTNKCSTNCVGQLCDSFIGSCKECPSGNKGAFCNETCDDFHFGPRCLNSCSVNCTDYKCNKTSGHCLSCYSGITGEFCDRVCDKTHYGPKCQDVCDYCSGGICDNVNGTCDKCDPGRYGERCTPCRNQTYGIDCRDKCSENCAGAGDCLGYNGTCVDGCQPGYMGDLCNTSCPSGYYGKNCMSTCSKWCIVNETELWCNKTDGLCLMGCRKGYTQTDRECSLFLSGIEPSVDSNPPLMAIVVPIVVVIIIALLVVGGIIFWRLRQSKNAETADPTLPDDVNTDADTSDANKLKTFDQVTTKPVGVIAAYCNDSVDLDSRDIPVSQLNEYMLTHSREFFLDEYRKLPVPENVTMLAGLSEENKHKNRYKNICAYDHSRVHLEINTLKNEGDYINASYIEGYNNEEKFIASQGPNDVIINDFVRMLWEQKVDKVVMLTNLIEDGTVKAVKYWPEEGKATFGDVDVELLAMHVFADYTIRNLELKKKNQPAHHFTHFHFTSWPDKGVPLTPWGLVDFEQRVALGSTSRPIVVHCSAGVGRTGTFIALRNVMREAEDTGRINCFQTVAKLRQDRVLMVQTAEQYEFLHRAAQVAIICMGTTVTANDITARIEYLQETSVSGINNLELEYRDVSKVSSDFNKHKELLDNKQEESNIYQNRISLNDTTRNRCSAIMPSKQYRASLACEREHLGDYINAVLISSFTKRENQILTQLPMPNTVTDFWRLVAQYNVKLVVAFQTESSLKDRTLGQYLPANMTTPLDCGPYEIHRGPVKSERLWEEQQITVKVVKKAMVFLPDGVTEESHVTHIASKSTDLNPKNLLKLLKHTRSNNVQAQGRVLYMCRNGAEYSGLACVLSLLLDRMDHDQSLTVPLVVGAIKCIRPQVIPSLAQYTCVYEVLKRYNELSTPYSNYDTISRGQQNLTLSTTTHEDENVYANS